MVTSEDYVYEEQESGGDSQDTDLISLSCFDLIKWLIKRIYSSLLLIFHRFMMSVGPWLSIDRESYWSCILNKMYSQCHSNPVFYLI